jgi:hypothetical protein
MTRRRDRDLLYGSHGVAGLRGNFSCPMVAIEWKEKLYKTLARLRAP